jgi:ABC-type multidrug transport system fused ATPase/permease subunit
LKAVFNNPYFNAIRNIAQILDADQKKRSIIMIGLLLLNAAFDVLGIAVIFPLIEAAQKPNLIDQTSYLSFAKRILGVTDNLTFLFILSLIVLAVFVLKNVASIVIYYIQARFCFNVSQRLIQKSYQYYYSQGYLHINNTDSGKKAYEILNIPYYFSMGYMLEALLLSTELLVLLIIFIWVLYTAPLVMLILVFVILPIFVLMYIVTKDRTKKLGDRRNILYPKAFSLALDNLNAYTDVKLHNKEKFFHEKFANYTKEINSIDAKQLGIYSKIHQRLNDLVLGIALAIVFGVAYFFRENQTQILSLLSILGLAAYRLLPSINRIMGSALALKNMSFSVEELLKTKGIKIHEYPSIEALSIHTDIRFENLTYRYPNTGNKVIKNLSFSINKGETIGIIGSSGSGKSTLLNIILRLIREDEGHIIIDGIPLSADMDSSYQKCIGYVQQSVFIKNGTLIENIAFGEHPSEINMKRVDAALEEAMLATFVKEQAMGLHMPLGENGVLLSGGQKQRIGIARALYKNAELLLFDEATSSLDPETEKAIVATISNLTRLGKTIIIVAHRVTTLEMCNKIYELKDGTIDGVYTYQEVLDKVMA